MKTERRTTSQGKIGHTRAFSGGTRNDDDDGGSTQTPLTSSGSDEGSGDAEGPAWARGKAERTGGCCSVNVTTSFVPHAVRS